MIVRHLRLGIALIPALVALLGMTSVAPAQTTRPVTATTRPTRVLLVAGGTSHDFATWFEAYDARLLEHAGFAATATEDPATAAAALARSDVAVVSTNDPRFDTPAFRAALTAFVADGHGLVLLHPATWYNFNRWPAYNAQLVGGGTRSHDPVGRFAVSVLDKTHPVMAGVPDTFDVVDELYHVNPTATTRPADTVAITVLAQTSPSRRYHTPHPSVWLPRSDRGRIVCIALGHDGRVHQLAAFARILTNAVRWTAGK